jgi:hypothetical protein
MKLSGLVVVGGLADHVTSLQRECCGGIKSDQYNSGQCFSV